MESEKVWRAFISLPPEGKRLVAKFISFLQGHYKRSRPGKNTKRVNIAEESFIGMWRDRQDMQDSSAWVRSLRGRERVK